MRRCVLILGTLLLSGTVLAQSTDLDAVGMCPVEPFGMAAAMETAAFWDPPTQTSWSVQVPPPSTFRFTAPARVFETDPFGGDAIEILLNGLVGDGLSLDGEFVRVGSDRLDGVGLLASDPSGDFRFEPDTTNAMDCITDVSRCARFDAVNVYHHIDSYVRQFWVGRMGVTPSFRAEARVHLAGDGGFADWNTRSLKLGVGDIFMKNSALSDDLIYHEYNHLLMASLGFEIGIGVPEETRALHEAYADYFMATWTDDERVGEWVVTCPPRQHCTGPANSTDLRTLVLDSEDWNWRQGQPSDTLKYGYCLRYHEGDRKCKASWNNFTNPYVWGMMWAAALWDLRTAVGAEIADRIAVEAVRTHRATTDFDQALEQIITAGRDWFGPNIGAQVLLAFEQRGFLGSSSVSTEEYGTSLDMESDIQVWPNPATDRLNVRSETGYRGSPMTWEVRDMLGKQVATGKTPEEGTWTIPTMDLPAGLYQLRVGVSTQSSTILFLKMH